jgi:excisionase family DNA binding protein
VIEREALRSEEVAEAIGVKVDTVQRWLQRGEMPGRKVGGVWLVGIRALREMAEWRGGGECRARDRSSSEPMGSG